MKRDALIRDLRRYARNHDLTFEVSRPGGKGSHHRIRLGEKVTTVQSGELTPFHVERLCKQLGIDPAEL